MEKKIVTEKEEMYIREAIKRQFYYLRIENIKLSTEAIYRLVKEIHFKVGYLAILKYLESIGLKESSSVETFWYKSNSYGDLISDEDRVFDFSIETFLTEIELKEFRMNNHKNLAI